VEKELRENEEKYRMLFESANDAIFLMDFEQFIDCNSNTLDMFGCEKRGDIVGHSPWDYSPDKQPDGRDSRDKAREHISAALDGKPQRFSWRHCRKDRTPFEAEVSLTSLILAGKKHLLAVVRDITERTQAERLQNAVYQISQAADKSSSLDDLFRSVHENIRTVMPAGNFYIALYDADKDLISFPYFVDEVDSPPAPLKPGKGLTEYVIRKGRSLLCDEATDQDLRGRGEVEVVGAPSAIWLGVPLSVENKTIGVMTVQHYSDPKAYGERELRMLEFVSTQVARSIERKRAEAELRENEQRLSLHVQQTPLAVIEWDKDFRVLQWNPAAEKIFGHPAEEAVGQHAAFIVPERFKEHVHQVWNDLMARKGGQRSTNENTTKDGRTIFCEWYNTSLVNSEGQVIGVASLAQDVTERKLSEEALLASEERFKNLFEKSAEAQLLLDHESNVIDCNTAFLRLFALQSKAEVLGRSPEDFAPEFQPDGTSSHERGLEVIRTVMEKGSARFEWEHRKHDDARTPIHNELICTMISIADRPMLHVAIRDITDRKAAEEALKSSEERLKLLYEYAPEAYYLSDLKGNFIDGNREAEKTLGFRKEEIIGQSFLKLKILSTSQLPKAAALLAKNALGKSTGPDEFILNRKDGTQVTTEIRTYPIKIKNQTLVLGIARDITERKQAEEALRDSEELHRKLLTSIPDMIIRTDLNGKILFANEVAVRAGGFSGGLELVGRNIFSFVSSEDRERAEASAKIMFEKRIDPQEVHLVLNGGSKILYEINGAVLRSPDQTPYGMVFLCRDITERKKAETDLHQSLKKLRTTLKAAIDSLASAIEMRDPYTAGHQERVTRLASAIAAEMSLDEDRIEGIQIAGIIHDIGKLYVPAEILSKPTKLSELEYSMIKMHSQVGYTILSKIDFPWPIAQIVHQHHETVNGSGYPLGLTGKDILLEAKILCVADVVEAMSSHRPYRPALGIQAALDEISQKRGILFDREVVDACLRLFAGKKFKFD
jgi:PAS domain S-box-containing protein/putative nucleotidyltransferase with HDIG domain